MTMKNSIYSRVNWPQASGEALLLLLGVLLALAGQAWWEARVERETISEYADNLLLEVNENETGLRRLVEQHDKYVNAGTSLLNEMRKKRSTCSMASIREQISILVYFGDFRPTTAALDNLVGAGGLGLLENSELRFAILKYAQSVSDHNLVQAEQADFFHQFFVPFLSKNVPLLEFEYIKNIPNLPTQSALKFDPCPLINSMEFENLTVRRIAAESDAGRYAQKLLNVTGKLQQLLQNKGE